MLSGWPGNVYEAAAAKFYNITAAQGLIIEDVLVEGRRYTAREDLQKAVDAERGDPILAFDPKSVRARIEQLSWVDQAMVERRLPKLVMIGLTERGPLALWQKNGVLRLIDTKGEVIAGADLALFDHLKIVTGEDAATHAFSFLTLLQAEPLVEKVTDSAVRVGGRRWDLHLENGMIAQLPETDVGLALSRLAREIRMNDILDKNISHINLSEPDRIIVRSRTGENNPRANDG